MQIINSFKRQAFTLVEMLVALAVGAIVIMATYASYEMVNTQYRKNIDIANMHTSGRSIMQIIERDVRMAGFEYRHTSGTNKGKKAFSGSITTPLDIKDSGNKCCDEVTVVYDHAQDVLDWKGRVVSNKVERIRVRYWAEIHLSNKGNRHRLYKQKDILGQNQKILAKPILGTKDVMADYIEDLQIGDTNNSSLLFASLGSTFTIIDTNKEIKAGVLGTHAKSTINDVVFGPNGLLYFSSGKKIYIYDTDVEKRFNSKNIFYINKDKAFIGTLTANSVKDQLRSISFAPNGLLYAIDPGGGGGGSGKSKVFVFDIFTKKQVNSFLVDSSGSIVVGSNGVLYTTTSKRGINAYSLKSEQKIENFGNSAILSGARLTYGPDKMLYSSQSTDSVALIGVIDTVNRDKWNIAGSICSPPISGRPGPIAISNGFVYFYADYGSKEKIEVYTLFDKSKKNCNSGGSTKVQEFNTSNIVSHINEMAFKDKKSEQKYLVNIDLTLRTKNQYGKDRQFKKKDYQSGNFKLDKTDKYKRDTFSTTVLVRNLAL